MLHVPGARPLGVPPSVQHAPKGGELSLTVVVNCTLCGRAHPRRPVCVAFLLYKLAAVRSVWAVQLGQRAAARLRFRLQVRDDMERRTFEPQRWEFQADPAVADPPAVCLKCGGVPGDVSCPHYPLDTALAACIFDTPPPGSRSPGTSGEGA